MRKYPFSLCYFLFCDFSRYVDNFLMAEVLLGLTVFGSGKPMNPYTLISSAHMQIVIFFMFLLLVWHYFIYV